MRKEGLLYQLITALLVPALLALVLAWVVYDQFEKSMESNANNYVENLVDSVAARLDSKKWRVQPDGTYMKKPLDEDVNSIAAVLKEMNLPGLFAVFRKDGTLIYGSPGKVNFLIDWVNSFDSPTPVKVRSKGGDYFTGMFYSIPDENIYIIGAVSWKMLFGSMVLLVTVWPFIMGTLAIITILAIYLLYEKVILPLRELDEEVSSLRLGYDLPDVSAPEAVPELQQLRSTFVVLAQSAIDKEQLSRDYITDIVKVQEEERERISREIHDGPLQDVTALVQRLRLLALDVSDEQTISSLENAEKVAMIGVKEMREFCNNLTPPWLDLGLRHSLAELCNRMSSQLGVQIDLDVEDGDDCDYDDESLPASLCLAFYRVVQESINNSVHHGGATLISVQLEKRGDRITMRIEDNGKGFDMPNDVQELRVQGHRGLSNMKERMRLAGGSLEITSTLGIGTIISCEVPLQTVE